MGYNGVITNDERGSKMHRFRKRVGLGLALALMISVLFPAVPKAVAAEYIVEPALLKGSDYTDSDHLAMALDEVFAGDIDIYSDSAYTTEVSMPVGLVMNNKTQYYVKSQTSGNSISGWQCYIYGNAVYNKLFREWVGHANSFANSQVMISGGDNLSYELMTQTGIRCGAYLRTTGNADGSYNGNVGHSMIILAYNQETITYLEGNGDGNGLIRVTIRTWEDFNSRQLSGRGRYIAHIVQPTEEFYQANYPSCAHESIDGLGYCSDCGTTYDWKRTEDPWFLGTGRVQENITPRLDAPYEASTEAAVTLERDQFIQITGRYVNAFDQVWYAATDDQGNAFFINAAYVKFMEYLPLEALCTDFSPADGAVLEQKSYPVKGTITSNFPLKSISGYLDGELYATWTANDENTTEVNLRQTELNQKLSFSKLEGGRHQVKIVVQSFVHGQPLTVHESGFMIVSQEPCNHDYEGTVTQDATCTEDGLLTYTCTKCDDSYTRTIIAPGHDYWEGVCNFCGDQLVLANLSGSVLSGGKADEPVQITLSGEKTYTATAFDGTFVVSGLLPGTYVLTVTKADCVPFTTELTLEPGNLVLDVKLCIPGDVTGDHRLNIGDVSKLYGHVRASNEIQDAYAVLCADYTGDGTVNIGDVGKLYNLVRR